jgi:protein-tyrosine phosphatase
LWRWYLVIDLHCHILPGIDDGARDLSVSLDMARASVNDGVTVLACTPHILPGLYHNTGPQIRQAVQQLQSALDDAGIELKLITGADAHIVPDFAGGLRSGHLLSLADTRYVLVELPHHVAPARLDNCFFDIALAGFVPILTHPERCTWIKQHYDTIRRLAQTGVWMQITAGSLTGAFGSSARYWAERMLDEGLVHILATDAHDTKRRPPNLSIGRDLADKRVGTEEAEHLVVTRPKGVVENVSPALLPAPSSSTAYPKVSNAENLSRSQRDRWPDQGGSEQQSRSDGGGLMRDVSDRLRRFFNN